MPAFSGCRTARGGCGTTTKRDGKRMYYADSPDLYTWQDKGKAAGQWRGEGPSVFRWKESYWMVIDNMGRVGVYRSDDA
jgi:hypothetical protein